MHAYQPVEDDGAPPARATADAASATSVAALAGPNADTLRRGQQLADGSARVQLQAAALPRQGAVVQRQIAFNDVVVDQTWNAVHKDRKKNAELLVAIEEARALCPGLTAEQFGNSWDRLRRAKSTVDLADPAAFAEAIGDSHDRAQKSSVRLAGNNGVSKALVTPMIEDSDKSLKFSGGARPKLVPTGRHVHTYDKTMEKQRQSARHLSTVLFETHKTGEEVQSSFARDKSEVVISTNLNKENDALRAQVTSQDDLKRQAVQVAVGQDLAAASHQEAMQDRVLRHAMKLFSRIDQYLAPDCKVSVPGPAKFDGRHAEIRIVQDGDGWSVGSFYLPAGVKAPCLGCALYFNAEGMLLGVQAGPMWLTAVSISTQIEEITGKPAALADLDAGQITAIAQCIARQYASVKKSSKQFKVGKSKAKGGSATIAHDPDSDSELDEEEFERVRERMLGHGKPKPPSRRGGGATARKRKAEDDDEDDNDVNVMTAPPPRKAPKTPVLTSPNPARDDDSEEEVMDHS